KEDGAATSAAAFVQGCLDVSGTKGFAVGDGAELPDVEGLFGGGGGLMGGAAAAESEEEKNSKLQPPNSRETPGQPSRLGCWMAETFVFARFRSAHSVRRLTFRVWEQIRCRSGRAFCAPRYRYCRPWRDSSGRWSSRYCGS